MFALFSEGLVDYTLTMQHSGEEIKAATREINGGGRRFLHLAASIY